LAPTEEMLDAAREALPELPAERRERYVTLGLGEKVATQLAFDPELGVYFEEVHELSPEVQPSAVANWITGELTAAIREMDGGKPSPINLSTLIRQVDAGQLPHQLGRQLLRFLVKEDLDPTE